MLGGKADGHRFSTLSGREKKREGLSRPIAEGGKRERKVFVVEKQSGGKGGGDRRRSIQKKNVRSALPHKGGREKKTSGRRQ